MNTRFAISLACLFTASTVARAENWPAWRGPTGNGLAPAAAYPTEFSASEKVLWKVELPGRGSSTPAVWGDSIFVTAPVDGKDAVLCYSRAGEERWRKSFAAERPGKHKNATGCNPSPVTDGEHVFVYYKSGTLAALDFAGKVAWRINLQERFGADTLWWDLGTSPVLAGDLVVVAVMQEGASFIVALSKRDGGTVWKTDRTYKVKKETGQAYTTPLVVGGVGEERLITFGSDHLTAHRAADGVLLWDCGGFNPGDKPMWRVIASPSISGGIVVVPYGRKQFFSAVRAGGQGDVTATRRLWGKEGVGSDVPSPIAHDGKAYLVTDRGAIHCYALEGGDEIWSQKLPRESANYYASPVLAGDLMVLPREDGVVMTMRLGKEGFELLGENAMGERIVASAVPVDGQLILRGDRHLFCIGR